MCLFSPLIIRIVNIRDELHYKCISFMQQMEPGVNVYNELYTLHLNRNYGGIIMNFALCYPCKP
jgi:hypothetical protein